MSIIDLKAIRLPRINIDHISVTNGSWVGVIGPSDSGKTALLLALMGQRLPKVTFDRQTDLTIADIGFVPSNPTFLFSSFKSSLLGEIQLSSQFVGRTPGNLEEIAHRFEVADLLTRDPYSLSGGEMARAALAIVAAKRPKVWLIDQIYDWLDPDMVVQVRKLFESELALGHAIVETHSASPFWVDRFDTTIFFDDGGHAVCGKYLAVARKIRNRDLLSEPSRLSMQFEADLGLSIDRHNEINAIIDALRPLVTNDKFCSSQTKTEGHPVAEIEELSFRYPHDGFAIGPMTLNLRKGQIAAVTGPNGSGKTTFLQCLADLLHPICGNLEILGARPTKRRWEWPRRAFYCFQNPDDQLYLPTVSEEIEKTLKLLNRPRPSDIASRYHDFGLTQYLAREPYQLARPIRRMVCLAAGLISSSPIILLDEPTSGLDVRGRTVIRNEITRMADNGFTFVMVSHDVSFVGEVATRILTFCGGQIVADSGLFPWPLNHIPPIVVIGEALNVKVHRYADLLHIARHQDPS